MEKKNLECGLKTYLAVYAVSFLLFSDDVKIISKMLSCLSTSLQLSLIHFLQLQPKKGQLLFAV